MGIRLLFLSRIVSEDGYGVFDLDLESVDAFLAGQNDAIDVCWALVIVRARNYGWAGCMRRYRKIMRFFITRAYSRPRGQAYWGCRHG